MFSSRFPVVKNMLVLLMLSLVLPELFKTEWLEHRSQVAAENSHSSLQNSEEIRISRRGVPRRREGGGTRLFDRAFENLHSDTRMVG